MKKLESNFDYHSNQAKGSTFFKKIHAQTLLHAITDKVDEEKDALVKGGAFHCAVLEPERFSSEYTIVPEDAPRRPSITQINAKKPSDETVAQIAWWNEFDLANAGKTILDRDMYDEVIAMRDAVLAHPIAKRMLSNGEAEYSYYVKDSESGIDLKCRPDYHNGGTLIDLKSTRSASFEDFGRQCGTLGYHLQAALYLDVFNASEGTSYNDFHFIAVENKFPFAVAIYRLTGEQIEKGREAYKKALKIFSDYSSEVLKENESPSEILKLYGYPMDIIELQIPYYLLDKIQA